MHTKTIRQSLAIAIAFLLASCTHDFFPEAVQHTRVVFNQPVDKRYAWLGNDAEVVDYQNELVNMINSATSTIEVSTMTFSKPEIAEALRDKANAGVKVRIVGNGGHRLAQDGWKKALEGKLDMVDNNLPALVYRVNFQKDAGAAPAGWLKDAGLTFGAHDLGVNYGWTSDQQTHIRTANAFQNSLLDDCYDRVNSDGPQTWEIEVPNGFYYVAAMFGEPNFGSNTFLKAEGQNFITFGGSTVPNRTTGSGSFFGVAVDGGLDDATGEDNGSNAIRIQVTDGRLSITVGDASGGGQHSTLCFLEIYRGDTEPDGDTSYDDGIDNTIQDRQTQHAKYIIVDAGLANQKVWSTSGNLTQSMDTNSEDAIVSTDPNLINFYLAHFNQQWGAATGAPNPAASNFGTYKLNTSGSFTIDGFTWEALFSPSVTGNDISTKINTAIGSSTRESIIIMEQFTSTGPSRGFGGSDVFVTSLNGKLASPSYSFYSVLGSSAGVGPGTFTGDKHVAFATSPGDLVIHNKYALFDALHDSRYVRQGRVICGSMNWSGSGLDYNDEQTLIINNAYIANRYLQHAMKRLEVKGIAPDLTTDIILVLDRSFSMNDASMVAGVTKIDAAKEAAKLFLDVLETDGNTRVSMVRFGQTVDSFAPTVALANFTPALRTAYKTGIDATAATLPIGNSTCYGAALNEVFAQMDAVTPHQRRLVHFFTDGKENCSPNSSTFISGLNSRKIEVHSTGFGADTDMETSLEAMATGTTGTYAQVDLDPLHLKKRFAEVAKNAMDLTTILDPSFTLKPGGAERQSVYFDEGATLGKFVITWPKGTATAPVISLLGPDGKEYGAASVAGMFTLADGYAVITLSSKKLDRSITGNWTVVIRASERQKENVLSGDLMVYGNGHISMRAECINDARSRNRKLVLARMLYKDEPVTGLTVRAEVTAPFTREYGSSRSQSIVLYDDGKHYDGKAGDGLYGALLTTKGVSSYQVHVISEGKWKDNALRREAMAFTTQGVRK